MECIHQKVIFLPESDVLTINDYINMAKKEGISWAILNDGLNFHSSVGSAISGDKLNDWIKNLKDNKTVRDLWGAMLKYSEDKLDAFISLFSYDMVNNYEIICGEEDKIKGMLMCFFTDGIKDICHNVISNTSSDKSDLSQEKYEKFISDITDFIKNSYMRFPDANIFFNSDGSRLLDIPIWQCLFFEP